MIYKVNEWDSRFYDVYFNGRKMKGIIAANDEPGKGVIVIGGLDNDLTAEELCSARYGPTENIMVDGDVHVALNGTPVPDVAHELLSSIKTSRYRLYMYRYKIVTADMGLGRSYRVYTQDGCVPYEQHGQLTREEAIAAYTDCVRVSLFDDMSSDTSKMFEILGRPRYRETNVR